MSQPYLWLFALLLLPSAVVAAAYGSLRLERLRVLSVVAALAALLLAAVPLFGWIHGAAAELPLVPELHLFGLWLGGAHLLRLDALSSFLVPLASALWLLTVSVTPRAYLDRAGLRRTALATLLTTLTFLTESPPLLVALWIGSVATYLAALSPPENRHARSVAAKMLGASSVAFAAGVLLVEWPGARGTTMEHAGIWLLVVAALIRKGIVPFHAWVPEVFDRGRLGPSVVFSAPQVGAYVTLVLIVPRAAPEVLRAVAIVALSTAVYGAALALVQRDARRACGYLFVSQSALVMAGLDCTSHEALAGSLVLWISSGLAFAGLARAVLVLEARRGRLDLAKHHGGYERMPLLATSFLLMGLACTGFPGTLGFIGEELLIGGAVAEFPYLGFFVVVAGALTGLAVLRMYFSLFCGRRDDAGHLELLRREAVVFGAIAVFLVGAGLAPGPLVAFQRGLGEELARQRHAHVEPRAGGQHP